MSKFCEALKKTSKKSPPFYHFLTFDVKNQKKRKLRLSWRFFLGVLLPLISSHFVSWPLASWLPLLSTLLVHILSLSLLPLLSSSHPGILLSVFFLFFFFCLVSVWFHGKQRKMRENFLECDKVLNFLSGVLRRSEELSLSLS